MSKITYTDKVTLNENPNVEDVNKVKANDLNEIKNVVNANDDNVGDLEQLQTTVKDNLVNAINEVHGRTIWKLVNSATGTNKITLPTNYDEILVICHDTEHNLNESVLIPKLFIDAFPTEQSFNSGYGQQGGYMGRMNLRVYNGKVWLYDMWVNTENVSSVTTTYCYYR